MPVTAKLSRLFYERLGEEVTNELVDWFNQVDATYRGELRELNELNFARFDAKVGERLAELRAEVKVELAEALALVRQELAERINATESRLLRWMFGFWIGTALVIVGARLAL